MTATSVPVPRAPAPDRLPETEQHSLLQSVALHLFPGAALFLFVLGAAALGVPAFVALLVGIGLVIAPLELGYLFLQGRRKSGRWTLEPVVSYRERIPARKVALWAVPLVAWWILVLVVSIAVLDGRIAESVFSWYPESIREFATLEDDGTTYATWVVLVFLVVALALNGVLGPVVEELYFRGHLLPRIARFGRGAPVLNTVLFSLYHLWTPWQNPGRIVALLPWIYVVWRKRRGRRLCGPGSRNSASGAPAGTATTCSTTSAAAAQTRSFRASKTSGWGLSSRWARAAPVSA